MLSCILTIGKHPHPCKFRQSRCKIVSGVVSYVQTLLFVDFPPLKEYLEFHLMEDMDLIVSLGCEACQCT